MNMTVAEAKTITLNQVSETIYNDIEAKFEHFLGSKEKAERLLNKHQNKTIYQIALCKFVDINLI